MSRRDFLGVMTALTSAGWLRAQNTQRPVFWVKLSVEVTDGRGRHINGLKPSDFRVLEDGILQTISTFVEGAKLAGRPGEAEQPGVDLAFGPLEDLGNSYTVIYYPRHNPNEGFRNIRVGITSDLGQRYRVRSRAGYRPQAF